MLSDMEFKRNQAQNAPHVTFWNKWDPSSTLLTGSFMARRNTEHYVIATGSRSIHRELNHYTNVIPYDLMRIVVYGYVGHGAEQNTGTHLNASQWVLE